MEIGDLRCSDPAERLRRYVRARNFGCLQNSVWITPDPMRRAWQRRMEVLRDAGQQLRSLTRS